MSILGNKKIISQMAGCHWILNLILAVALAIFAILFVPFAWQHQTAWLVGLTLLSYLFLKTTFGFRSWISQDKNGQYFFCYRDNHSRTNVHLPFDYILNFDPCEYAIGKKEGSAPSCADPDYFFTHQHLGYQGPGIEICYRYPRHLMDDDIVRGCRLPAPKADEFIAFVKTHGLGQNEMPKK